MNQHFVTKLHINHVRHLKNIEIPLSGTECRHLIVTGKNGSGKTSVMEALAAFLSQYTRGEQNHRDAMDQNPGVTAAFHDEEQMRARVSAGKYLLAYYPAEREYQAQNESNIEKVKLQDSYGINDRPGKNFVKYILNLKAVGAMGAVEGKKERAREIEAWFENFDQVLQLIFDDPKAHLDFDMETFAFHIIVPGREPFAFDTLSSGYAIMEP